MAKAVPLTTNEELTLMRSLFNSKGLTVSAASLLEKEAKSDQSKHRRWRELQEQFATLKSEAQRRKLGNRDDKSAKTVLRTLTPTGFDTYKAQAKYQSACETGGIVQKLFAKNGRLSSAEAIVLLSNSKQSSMQPVDIHAIEHFRMTDDVGLCRVAARFCKRFGLKA